MLWWPTPSSRGSVDVLSALPGAQPVRLFHIAGEFSVPVAASGNRVLLRTASEGGASDLYSGPLAGPLTKLESCPQSSQLVFPPGPALDGDTSIWSGEGCVPNRLEDPVWVTVAHRRGVGAPGPARRRGALRGLGGRGPEREHDGGHATPDRLRRAGGKRCLQRAGARGPCGRRRGLRRHCGDRAQRRGGRSRPSAGTTTPHESPTTRFAAPTPHPVPVPTSCNSAVRIAGG